MKIAIVLGTRPEIIKMASVMDEIEKRGHELLLIHTGQHYDKEMSDNFFRDLEIPAPDYNIQVGSGTHGKQTGLMMEGIEKYDIMFSGHEHSYARSFPRRNNGLYDKPSEGTIHYNIGSGNRNPPGTRVVPKVWNDCTYEHEEDLSMFSIVDIDGDKCTLTAYVEDGRIVDRCVIDKKEDSITPIRRAPKYNRPRLKFKGYDLGLCVMGTPAREIDGIWYVPVGQIVKFMGGESKHTEGKVRIEVYDRFAEYSENSSVMVTSQGEKNMTAPCLRLDREQLYVPVEDFCSQFRMYWAYFKYNNFISIESDTEMLPVSYQP
jgi:hypothetical protein